MNTLNNTINFSIDFGALLPLIIFATALIVSYICYPVIIKVSNDKNLMAEPNQRDVHSTKTPNLGGIGVFIAVFLTITFLGNYFSSGSLLNLSGAMIIMFFIGLVDDLIGISPKSKLIGQVVVALSIIIITDLRVDNFYGILGIYEIPYLVSVFTTVMLFVTFINAYNLIDGVDGLAGSFAITANIFFTCFFYFNGNHFMSLLSLGVVGALISFLVFNFSKSKKIFMGDTGSMVIGFLLAYQSVHFMTGDFNVNFTWLDSKSIIYFLAIFSFPLIDTLRVFFIRIKAGKSPFSADNNHIHHNLLNLGLKHWEIALIASIFTVFAVLTVSIFSNLEINKLFLVLVTIWFLSVIIIDNLSLFVLPLNIQIKKNSYNASSLENAISTENSKVIYLKETA